MNLNIPISQEIESKLREQAVAAGMDIESFVLDALRLKLANSSLPQHKDGAEKPVSQLLGLFSDDQGTIDEVMESVYEGRATPFRVE